MGLPALLTFENQEVRIVDKDGDAWWVLADICRVLELANSRDTASRLDADERDTVDINDGIQGPGNPNVTIISEPGLYKLLETSRKPVARRFNRWVRHEVLPSIRKTGAYGDHIVGALAEVNVRFDYQDKEISDLKTSVARVDGKVDYLSDNVTYLSNTLMPRRDFSAMTHRVWRTVVYEFCNGHCPCGCGRKILDRIGNWVDDKTDDHFYGRNRNKTNEGWPVLVDCNQELKDPKKRAAKQPAFTVFIGYCEKVAARNLQRKAKARASKTVVSPKQGSFRF